MVPTIDHWIGQYAAIRRFKVALEAAWIDSTRLPHMLFVGCPGTGKTLLAHLAAKEIGVRIHERVAQVVNTAGALNGLLLPIRRRFDQYICERPSILYPGVTSPLSGKKPWDIDLVVIRENTEGEYANIGGFAYHEQPEEVAIQTSVMMNPA